MGPLPSSIYWRRRAVVLCLLALAVVLVVWAVNSGGGGGGKGSGGPTGSHTPVATITAGPAPTGTHISGRPGGRDTAPSDGSTDGGAGSGSSDGAGSGGTAGSAGSDTAGSGTAGSDGTGGGTAGSSGGTSDGGGSGGSASDATSGGELPVGSTLPDCAPGSVQLALASAQNSYGPGETPAFRLTATNTSEVTCKVDFGPAKAVFTVTKATDNSHVWASDDCPKTGAYLMQVPAHGSTTYTVHWNEKNSSAKCASPKGQQAALGTTYLVSAQMSGYGSKQVSFVLSSD
ncbi:hypothetical protein [Actinacidiphila acidipaludis]|uniref:hypothetical protein n=1 Tax=Actinacidiphila acidipaludis TaxID=2873382 RepID=UPI0027DFAAF8|nr:hypothetical protein [Streptomyces acidipaludis]